MFLNIYGLVFWLYLKIENPEGLSSKDRNKIENDSPLYLTNVSIVLNYYTEAKLKFNSTKLNNLKVIC